MPRQRNKKFLYILLAGLIVCLAGAILLLSVFSFKNVTEPDIEGTQPPDDEAVISEEDNRFERGDIARVYISTGAVSHDSENLALNKPVIVSSLEVDDFIGGYAVDGDPWSRWSSSYNDDEYIIVDLDDVYEIGYVGITWEHASGKEYEILVSVSGDEWISVASEKNGGEGLKNYTFAKVPARYVMIQGIERNTEYGYSIYEIVVAEKKPGASTVRGDVITSNYTEVSISVVDKSGGEYKTITDDSAIIRVRGNSTAGAPKKPYNIKFSSSQSPLGMESGKKWCLLANHFDKTLMRNKIAYDFSGIAGAPCWLESRFVEVYLDGKLQGNYMLVEPVSDGKNRVNIYPENGEYILERMGAWSFTGGSYNNSPIYGINFRVEVPEEYELTSDQRKELSEYLKKADNAAQSGDQKLIEEIFDVNSFVAMYITYELFKDCDMYHGSTYFYIKNGKIYAGPLWDMDLSMGNVSHTNDEDKYRTYNNVSNYRGRSFGDASDDSASGIWAQIDWYQPLMECEFFYNLVVERYRELIPQIEDIYDTGGLIDRWLDEYGASFYRNYEKAGWSLTVQYSPYERTKPDSEYMDNVDWLKAWLYRRDVYLREYFGI